jgi:hypothetical protein
MPPLPTSLPLQPWARRCLPPWAPPSTSLGRGAWWDGRGGGNGTCAGLCRRTRPASPNSTPPLTTSLSSLPRARRRRCCCLPPESLHGRAPCSSPPIRRPSRHRDAVPATLLLLPSSNSWRGKNKRWRENTEKCTTAMSDARFALHVVYVVGW